MLLKNWHLAFRPTLAQKPIIVYENSDEANSDRHAPPMMPAELILEIMTLAILSSPCEDTSPMISTFRQVSRLWCGHARYLAFLSVTISVELSNPSDALIRLGRLKANQDPNQEPRRAVCRSLSIVVIFNHYPIRPTQVRYFDGFPPIIEEIFQTVGQSIHRLQVCFKGTPVDSLFPTFISWNPYSTSIPFSFPRLTDLTTIGVPAPAIWALVRATGSDHLLHLPPSSLYIRHDFEAFNERHLLSLPATVFWSRKGMQHALGQEVADGLASAQPSRPSLTIAIDRRHRLAELLERFISNGLPRKGIQSVNVWLKDSEETVLEIDDIMRREEWRSEVQWNVLPRATGLGERTDGELQSNTRTACL